MGHILHVSEHKNDIWISDVMGSEHCIPHRKIGQNRGGEKIRRSDREPCVSQRRLFGSHCNRLNESSFPSLPGWGQLLPEAQVAARVHSVQQHVRGHFVRLRVGKFGVLRDLDGVETVF